MLFDCNNVRPVWQCIPNVLNLNISWKNIVIGFRECNNISYVYNVIISLVSKTIYKKWTKNSENYDSLNYESDIIIQLNYYRKMNTHKDLCSFLKKCEESF